MGLIAKKLSGFFLAAIILFLQFSCSSDKENPRLDLPPKSSMSMDYEMGTSASSGGRVENGSLYFAVAALHLGFWSGVAAIHTALPVAAFEKAFDHQASWSDDEQAWIWQYNVALGSDSYSAKLTGEIESDSVKWQMYISKSGNPLLENILWFHGKSHYGRRGGWWVINHPVIQNISLSVQPAIKVDWTYDKQDIFSLKHTYVANQRFDVLQQKYVNNAFKGNYIEYGKTSEAPFDAYYIIFAADKNEKYTIRWNSNTKEGSIQKEGAWSGCWNGSFQDMNCD
ncbi:MAG: hypothetical protein JJU28_07230 [Cyclobacteriaceae bacterium]|nr:hypothetical protein [Cyclobacteriaceae bacterium]